MLEEADEETGSDEGDDDADTEEDRKDACESYEEHRRAYEGESKANDETAGDCTEGEVTISKGGR